MEAIIYEEKSYKNRPSELVIHNDLKKSYYEEDVKYLHEHEIIKLLNSVENEFQKMLYLFLFETGCRITEALSVKIMDIDFNRNTVKLITLKRQNKNIVRILTLSETLMNKILKHEKDKKLTENDYIFTHRHSMKSISTQAVNQALKKLFKKIFPPEYLELAHPHTFRHSRAIQLLNSGVNLMQVKTILGHSNIINTMIYLKYSNTDIQNRMVEANRSMGII